MHGASELSFGFLHQGAYGREWITAQRGWRLYFGCLGFADFAAAAFLAALLTIRGVISSARINEGSMVMSQNEIYLGDEPCFREQSSSSNASRCCAGRFPKGYA